MSTSRFCTIFCDQASQFREGLFSKLGHNQTIKPQKFNVRWHILSQINIFLIDFISLCKQHLFCRGNEGRREVYGYILKVISDFGSACSSSDKFRGFMKHYVGEAFDFWFNGTRMGVFLNEEYTDGWVDVVLRKILKFLVGTLRAIILSVAWRYIREQLVEAKAVIGASDDESRGACKIRDQLLNFVEDEVHGALESVSNAVIHQAVSVNNTCEDTVKYVGERVFKGSSSVLDVSKGGSDKACKWGVSQICFSVVFGGVLGAIDTFNNTILSWVGVPVYEEWQGGSGIANVSLSQMAAHFNRAWDEVGHAWVALVTQRMGDEGLCADSCCQCDLYKCLGKTVPIEWRAMYEMWICVSASMLDDLKALESGSALDGGFFKERYLPRDKRNRGLTGFPHCDEVFKWLVSHFGEGVGESQCEKSSWHNNLFKDGWGVACAMKDIWVKKNIHIPSIVNVVVSHALDDCVRIVRCVA